MDMLINGELGILHNIMDVQKYVKYVYQDIISINGINAIQILQIVLPLILQENVLNVTMDTHFKQMELAKWLSLHQLIHALHMDIGQKENGLMIGLKDAHLFAKLVLVDITLIKLTNVKFYQLVAQLHPLLVLVLVVIVDIHYLVVYVL